MKIDEFNGHLVEALKELKETSFRNILIIWWVWVGKTTIVSQIFPDFFFMSEAKWKQHIVSGTWSLMPAEMNRSTFNVTNHPLEALSRFENVFYDDVGVADLSPAYIEKTLYWLDERRKPFWDRNKKTIFTTNLTLEELRWREERIASRILDHCHVFILDGPDRRQESTIYHTNTPRVWE